MADGAVLVESDGGGVTTVTLNRPEALNSLSLEVEETLQELLPRLEADDGTRVVVITGAGRAFSGGGDVKEMRPGGAWDISAAERQERLEALHSVAVALHALPKPVIAMVNGVAVGAGCNLALACDLRLASEKAKFGLVFRNVGLGDDMGGAWLLPRLVGMGKALELFFTGGIIDATEAHRIGMVNRVVPAESLVEETYGLARSLTAGPAKALGLIKEELYGGITWSFQELLDFEAQRQSALMSEHDHQEGVAAFVEKRPPMFTD
ncbi:MAG: enoyl-CoA hydratase [Chloroflexi bacterium]|nr:enoyl-CoA hydratase [Chloroflexota bacterium]